MRLYEGNCVQHKKSDFGSPRYPAFIARLFEVLLLVFNVLCVSDVERAAASSSLAALASVSLPDMIQLTAGKFCFIKIDELLTSCANTGLSVDSPSSVLHLSCAHLLLRPEMLLAVIDLASGKRVEAVLDAHPAFRHLYLLSSLIPLNQVYVEGMFNKYDHQAQANQSAGTINQQMTTAHVVRFDHASRAAIIRHMHEQGVSHVDLRSQKHVYNDQNERVESFMICDIRRELALANMLHITPKEWAALAARISHSNSSFASPDAVGKMVANFTGGHLRRKFIKLSGEEVQSASSAAQPAQPVQKRPRGKGAAKKYRAPRASVNPIAAAHSFDVALSSEAAACGSKIKFFETSAQVEESAALSKLTKLPSKAALGKYLGERCGCQFSKLNAAGMQTLVRSVIAASVSSRLATLSSTSSSASSSASSSTASSSTVSFADDDDDDDENVDEEDYDEEHDGEMGFESSAAEEECLPMDAA